MIRKSIHYEFNYILKLINYLNIKLIYFEFSFLFESIILLIISFSLSFVLSSSLYNKLLFVTFGLLSIDIFEALSFSKAFFY